MKQRDLEQALRGALRPADPGADFCDRVSARLAEGVTAGNKPEAADGAGSLVYRQAETVRERERPGRRGWLPLAIAAALVASVGLAQWLQQHQRERGIEARAQLLQGLQIASGYLVDARAAVMRAEQSRL